MAVTVTLYDATAANYAEVGQSFLSLGLILLDSDKATLFTASDFEVSAMVAAHDAGTHGWTAGSSGGEPITSPVAQSGNDAYLNADPVSVTASGGSITAKSAIVAEITGLPNIIPIAFIDFGGTETATAGNNFTVSWPSGIITWTYT